MVAISSITSGAFMYFFVFLLLCCSDDSIQSYAQFKQAAKEYQKTKYDFQQQLPGWTIKPSELQAFTVQEDGTPLRET